jgi:hypothetical protein|tara:strand:+ start:38623 stop:38775 length:153 start_codon:yes stop_codon:yes gene_type:complete
MLVVAGEYEVFPAIGAVIFRKETRANTSGASSAPVALARALAAGVFTQTN